MAHPAKESQSRNDEQKENTMMYVIEYDAETKRARFAALSNHGQEVVYADGYEGREELWETWSEYEELDAVFEAISKAVADGA